MPNVRTWWEEILTQVELVAGDLFEFIRDAQDIDLDFAELPFTVTEFYSLLGFPGYLADRAASDAEANAAYPVEIDMWTLHSGATYTLTHFFQGKEGTSLDGYVRTANDILFNPEGTIERVERAYEEQLEAVGDDGRRRRSPASGRSRASSASATIYRRTSTSSRSVRTHFVSGSRTRWPDDATKL